MRILALDLGTKTGWALWNGVCRTSGTKILLTPKEQVAQKAAGFDRCCDVRPARLKAFIESANPDVIYYEDVQFLSTQLQTQLWGALHGVVQLFHPKCKIVAVPVGTLKKFAAGHGHAKKWDMAAALNSHEDARWVCRGVGEKLKLEHFCPGMSQHQTLADDNEVDAIHLLRLALTKEKYE